MSNPIVSDSEAMRAAIMEQKPDQVETICRKVNNEIDWRIEGDALLSLAKGYDSIVPLGDPSTNSKKIFRDIRRYYLHHCLSKDFPKTSVISNILTHTTLSDFQWRHPSEQLTLAEVLSKAAGESAKLCEDQRDQEYAEITIMLTNRLSVVQNTQSNFQVCCLPCTELLSAATQPPPGSPLCFHDQ